jgi:hypothetical protein
VTEADVVLWTGVAVGLIGLAATASNGVSLMLLRIREGVATARRWIDHQLAQIFLSRRKNVIVVPLAATAVATSSFSGALYATVTPPPDAPIGVQLDAIRSNMGALGECRFTEVSGQRRYPQSSTMPGEGRTEPRMTNMTSTTNVDTGSVD